MRITTLAAAVTLSFAATVPFSTAAFAEGLQCELGEADASGAVDAWINGPDCRLNLDHTVDKLAGQPGHGRDGDRRDHDCDTPIRDRIPNLDPKDLDPEHLAEQLDPKKLVDDLHDKDWKPNLRDCGHDKSDHEKSDHDKSDHRRDKDDDHDKKTSDHTTSDKKSSDDSDDSDDSDKSTQVKVVPKGAVDTGDGSSL